MALATVATLVSRLQTLLDDPAGQWATYDYLSGFILQANEDLNAELDAYNLAYNEQVVTLTAVSAQTSDLGGFMDAGQPLENMLNPILLEYRPTGGNDDQWVKVPRKDKVIDDADAQNPESWEWRGQVIYLTPCSQVVDFRLRFDAITVDFTDPTNAILRGSLNVLAYRTARIVASLRGGLSGSGKPLAEEMQMFELEAKDSFESLFTKRSQSVRRSFGRNGGNNGGGANWSTPVF